MSVNEALRIVRTRWRTVVVCLLLGLLGAGVATTLTPRQYSSNVTLYVSLQGRAESSEAAYQASQLATERVVSYAPLLKDGRITQPVIDRLQLGTTPAELADRITVTVQPETVVLSAAVTDISPDRAAATANALAEEFVGLVQELEQPFGPAPPPAAPGQQAQTQTKIGVQIIRPAAADPNAISPNVPFNLALGGALGLLAGLAGAFLRNARDTHIRSADRLRALTGAPILSEIAADRDARRHPLTLGAPPGSLRVEAFRKLRTNLQFIGADRPHRVIVVTSAAIGEGKSTTACNLALALADAGSRVLLVDVNLRSPQVDRYLGLAPGAGVVNVLAGRISVRHAVLRWIEGGLDVLPAGPVPFNPSELLASRATAELIDEVKQRYDFVILDAPALLPVTDAAAVAARADGVVLVVRHGRTSEEQVAAAMATLDAVHAPLLGVALTGTPAPRWRRRPIATYPELDPVPSQQRTPAPTVSPKPPVAQAPPRTLEIPPAAAAGSSTTNGTPSHGTPTHGTPASGVPTNGQEAVPTEQLANGMGGRPSPTPRS